MRVLPSYKDFLIYVIKHNGNCPPVYKEVNVSCKHCYFYYYCCKKLNVQTSMSYRKTLAIQQLNHYSKSTLDELLFEEYL